MSQCISCPPLEPNFECLVPTELEFIWREAVLYWSKILSRHLLEVSSQNFVNGRKGLNPNEIQTENLPNTVIVPTCPIRDISSPSSNRSKHILQRKNLKILQVDITACSFLPEGTQVLRIGCIYDIGWSRCNAFGVKPRSPAIWSGFQITVLAIDFYFLNVHMSGPTHRLV